MTIRGKAILAIVLTFISLIVVLFVISRFIFLQNIKALEEKNTQQNVERVLNALSYSISNLESITSDYSSWDDTYAFIEDNNSEYVKINLVDSTFIGLRLNLMLFVNSSGQVVFSKAFDFNNLEEMSVPQSLQSYLSGDSLLLSNSTNGGTSGILLLPESAPLMVVSKPILTSEEQGPARGTLIFARYFESTEIEGLAELTSLSLAFYRVDDTDLPSDVRDMLPSLLQEASIKVYPYDAQNIAGYTLVNDIYGNPGLMLKVNMPRDLYRESSLGILYLLLAIAVIGAVYGTLAILLADKMGLSRLKRLAETVKRIGDKGSISERITATGHDEISSLADSINNMLVSLQRSGDNLIDSEKRYRSIFETTGSAMVVAREDSTIVMVNNEFEKLSGYSREELENKKKWMEFVKNEVSAIVEDHHSRWEKNPRIAPRNFECQFVNRDGIVKDILLNVGMMADSKMSVASIIDITKLKEAEKTLQKLYDKEAKLYKDLKDEVKNRIEFTRALVHELKTPMTPLLTSSDMLLEDAKEEPLLSLAKNISQGASRLNKRIDELLDIARGETGTLRLTCDWIEPIQLIREITEEMTPMFSRHGKSLKLELPDTLPKVWADEERLRQVLVNLLTNAYKFTPEKAEITIRAYEKDSSLIWEVQDTGYGISEVYQKDLFQPYYRRGVYNRGFRGLGLGLSLCRTFVELHGGSIWVKSQVGKGSTFGFSIPLKNTDERSKSLGDGEKNKSTDN